MPKLLVVAVSRRFFIQNIMKKYNIIYADPPWKFSNRLRNGTPESNGTKNIVHRSLSETYNTMSIEEISNLKVNEISEKDCVLFMWTTDAHLEEAMKVIKAWGFKYKTIGFTWLKKEKSGVQSCYVGFWTLKCGEICLLATKGNMSKYLKKRNVRQLVEEVRGKHSEKPNEVRNRIVEMFGSQLPKIELFSRQQSEGWDVWGNEVDCSIVL